MIKIAEFLPPKPSQLWQLSKQAGADYAVGGLPVDDPQNGTAAPWDYMPLLRMKERYENGGFDLAVIVVLCGFTRIRLSIVFELTVIRIGHIIFVF